MMYLYVTKIRLAQILELTKMIVALLVSFFIKKNDLWIISERGFDARDNGFVFYQWLSKNHPEIKIKYIITKSSIDYHKFSNKNDLIEFDSFQHRINICLASHLISTHAYGFMPLRDFYKSLDKKFGILKNKKKIFLQHGIIKDRIPYLFKENFNVDLFVTSTFSEYNYIISEYGHNKSSVCLTGLCRFDHLHDFKLKRQILIMPTWRHYINKAQLKETEYFKRFVSIIQLLSSLNLLNKLDYKIIFYPHSEFQDCINLFKQTNFNSSVIIADMSYDVQQLLKDSEILITDYSSVFFDFIYMKKPVLFYQFDSVEFRKYHYHEGYFKYSDIGPVFDNELMLVKLLSQILLNKEKFQTNAYVKKEFPFYDTNNCNRVFKSIQCINQK